MSVRRCRAALLSVYSEEIITHFRFSIALHADSVGHPCTGQGLEAIEWSSGGHLVVVGTEDGEYLRNRIRGLESSDFDNFMYTPTELILDLWGLPTGESLSFHFVIAENPDPEPVEASAWYAVDCAHQQILTAEIIAESSS